MPSAKVMYRPVGLAVGMGAGALAGLAFQKVWALVSDEEAPAPTDENRRWREVVLAAAIQGAIFTATRAVVDRGGAKAVKRATGTWPG
ncbi:DUF4235 domain-containing protein [Streptomyces albidoflavus]|uniref:DUF4235 domain-containing protein n=1 Tax=Streptomyces albidoflavus TaxID=1886 RepID=UPI001C47DB06|nr:DUF4235 domain-containing protein [Streptomyces albidoflavus]MBV7652077.1 DUF4235 domain-containing protein [Streptomyces albidoflavus]MBV7713546.1 DUF4235 domain-containing protein [Streptomyces albidoflavus]